MSDTSATMRWCLAFVLFTSATVIGIASVSAEEPESELAAQAAIDALVSELTARSVDWSKIQSNYEPDSRWEERHRSTFARLDACTLEMTTTTDFGSPPALVIKLTLDLARVDLARARVEPALSTSVDFGDEMGGGGFSIDYDGATHLVELDAPTGQPWTGSLRDPQGAVTPTTRTTVTVAVGSQADGDAILDALREAAAACPMQALTP